MLTELYTEDAFHVGSFLFNKKTDMKKKLKLTDLQVQSFVTNLNGIEQNEKVGGVQQSIPCLTGSETYFFPCTHGGGLCGNTLIPCAIASTSPECL